MSNDVITEKQNAELSNDDFANGVYEKRTFIDKKGNFMSAQGAAQIKKTKEIISLLNGLTVFEVKIIISALQNHLDHSSVLDIKQYELNIEPIFKDFHVLRD